MESLNFQPKKKHYAPTLINSTKKLKLADDFYNSLDNTLNSIPKCHAIFIGADTMHK